MTLDVAEALKPNKPKTYSRTGFPTGGEMKICRVARKDHLIYLPAGCRVDRLLKYPLLADVISWHQAYRGTIEAYRACNPSRQLYPIGAAV